MAASVVLEPCHNASIGRRVRDRVAAQREQEIWPADRARSFVTRASPGRSGRPAGAEWRRQDHRRALAAGIEPGDIGQGAIFGGNPRDRASRLRLGAMLQVGRMPETLRVREHLQLFSSYYAQPAAAR